ncbi:hypothetical protein ACH4YN_38155 [Streptomyces griseofuscus]|uniref:hypothetical protein n=1 Tax=Streptomyces griseofuscus TaxID=146922 RepID=UPI0037B35509
MTTAPSRPEIVPFVAAWSGEAPQRRRVIYGARGGIAFADETPEDRDQHGVLWNGRAHRRGTGRPEYGDVHPGRQRVAMEHRLCQVCGSAADHDARGTLWLIEDHRGDWRKWPEGLLTTHPPLCLPCAGKAVRMCPHLIGGSLAVRVRESEVCAVYGRVWSSSAFGYPVRTANKEVVTYGTAAARWVLAGQLVRSLHGCTVVDLERELAP